MRMWLAFRARGGLEVDDIIQQMYVILAGLDSVDEIRNPMGYALQTAYSVIQAHLRRSKIVSFSQINDAEGFGAVSDAPSPEREASAREELQMVSDIIRDLPQRHQQVFVMRRILGLSHKEIAERLQISENTIEKMLTVALQLITEAFKRGGSFRARTSMKRAKRSLFRLMPK